MADIVFLPIIPSANDAVVIFIFLDLCAEFLSIIRIIYQM